MASEEDQQRQQQFQLQQLQQQQHQQQLQYIRITGYLQMVCGVASVMIGVTVTIFVFSDNYDSCYDVVHPINVVIVSLPIWGGLIYFLAGSLGGFAKAGNKCLIAGYMVMSIIAAVLAVGQAMLQGFVGGLGLRYCQRTLNCDDELCYGMYIGSALAATMELIAALWGSIYISRNYGVCCAPLVHH